ncbi:expressed unknown protein [Seminavis robusta]|uniref:Uncharacterized protein n=1 Tax=Seminavis robusta TaxID=568900 RepID=A0A9N8HBY7_9STRA|nr:expressed unknown protein [Seminavis robusta]|eukprot:Sro356_g125430.1 n/a (659) ;mRNA; f:56414-58390
MMITLVNVSSLVVRSQRQQEQDQLELLVAAKEVAVDRPRADHSEQQQQQQQQQQQSKSCSCETLPILESRSNNKMRQRQRRTLYSPWLVLVACLALLLILQPSVNAQESQSRQVHKYALPAFSMVLRVSVDRDEDDGDDDEVYLDLEIFQETLEHVTQFHLTDIFQQHTHQHDDSFQQEQFIRVQLSSKVRQEIVQDGAPVNREHVPLHAGFNGIVSYSFPSDAVPPTGRVEQAISNVLEDALVAENYLLLFRRYLSSGALSSIEDVYQIAIGTQQLTVLETNTNKPLIPNDTPSTAAAAAQQNNANKKKQLNAVTIVAIVIFLTLSCLLMLFGATVVLLMKDRAKQERSLNGQTMTSIGMGTKKNGNNDDEEDDNDDQEERLEDDERTTDTSEAPAWKRAILPVLRKAIMVRRYWKKHVRRQRKARKHDPNLGGGGTSSDDSSNASGGAEDDGLNDEDVYYDENLTDEEAANQWLDAWQASITSIPLRSVRPNTMDSNSKSPSKKHVKKKKASKMPLAPRPATRQSKNTFLCCIAEEDSVVDGASVCNMGDLELGNDDSLRSTSSRKRPPLELDRIQELTSVVMEDAATPYGTSVRKKKPLPLVATSSSTNEDSVSSPMAMSPMAMSPMAASPMAVSPTTLLQQPEQLSDIQDVDLS